MLDCAVSLGVDMKLIFDDPDKIPILSKVVEGHLNVIEFLSKEDVDFDDAEFVEGITEKGRARDLHWTMAKWMIERDIEEMTADLARKRQLDMLK